MIRFTVFPILSSIICLVCKLYVSDSKDYQLYNKEKFAKGMLSLLIAIICFIRGLDEKNDPYRFFHGLWHGFVSISAFYNFQVLPPRSNQLPTKYNDRKR